MTPLLAAQLAVVVLWSAIHLGAGRLRFLDHVPRSAYLSVAGGVSVAYVFLHILPELRAAAHTHHWPHPVAIEALALSGLIVFYGLERMVTRRQTHERAAFWLHLASFAVYGVLIGLFLAREPHEDWVDVLLAGFALGLHLLANDYGLAKRHGDWYAQRGRYVLAACPPMGWALGRFLEIPAQPLDGGFAFLAGGIVLNTLKEELPEERESRFSAFLVGALAYGGALLLLART